MNPSKSFRIWLAGLMLVFLVSPLWAKTFLWQVKSDSSTVYLLGSMHLAQEDLYPLPPIVEQTFKQADHLVLELDFLEASAEIGRLVVEKGLYLNDDTIFDHISEEVKVQLEQYAKQHGFPLQQFVKYKPGLLAVTLTAVHMKQLGYSEELGIDWYFYRKAREKNIPVSGLETAEQQMNALLDVPDPNSVIKYTLLNMSTIEKFMDEMIKAWRGGDTDAIYKLIYADTVKQYPGFKPYLTKLIDHRNIGMADKIKTYLKTDKVYFVIVGAGHLIGEQGVNSLLQQAGYTVQQL